MDALTAMINVSHRRSHKKILTLGALYASLYLGQGFFYLGFVAILRDHDVFLEQIGLIHVTGLFWVLKFLWAPFLDRCRLPFFNAGVGWVVVFQIAMTVSLLGIGWCNFVEGFTGVLLLFSLYSFFAATQEACVSSLALTALSPVERGMGGGLQTAGGFWGTLVGGGGMLILYPYAGWQGTILVMSVMTLLPLFGMGCFTQQYCAPLASSIEYKRVVSFWKEQGNALWSVLIVGCSLPLGMGYGLLTPALTDRGWSMGQIGFAANSMGALLGLITSLGMGKALRFVSRTRALVLVALASLLAVGLFPCVVYARHEIFVFLAIFILFMGVAATQSVLVTGMMDRSSPSSPATDFSIQFCLFSFIGVVAPYLGLTIAGKFGYDFVFLCMMIFQSTIAFILLIKGHTS